MNAHALSIVCTDMLSATLWSVGLRRPWRSGNDPRLVYYHGIGEGDSPCFRFLDDEVRRDVFASHLAFLSQQYRIVPLAEAVRSIEAGVDHDPPVCSISFDDGLRSVYTDALPELRARGLSATVFLNTVAVGNEHMTWLHALSYLLSAFGIERVHELCNSHRADSVKAIPTPASASGLLAWYKTNYEAHHVGNLLSMVYADLGLSMAETAAEQRVYLEWDEIDVMAQQGISFSSHTKSHAPLARFSTASLRQAEIVDARRDLSGRRQEVDLVSFPFGMAADYGTSAVDDALEAGHRYVLEVGNGVNRRDDVLRSKVLARVPLGAVSDRAAHLHSAIEVRPTLKAWAKGR